MPLFHVAHGTAATRLRRASIAWLLALFPAASFMPQAPASYLYAENDADSSTGDAARATPANRLSSRGYRGPVDLVVGRDEIWCVTANHISDSLTLIDLRDGRRLDEVACAGRPESIARIGETEVIASCRYSGKLERFRIVDERLIPVASIDVGFEPLGITVFLPTHDLDPAAQSSSQSVAPSDRNSLGAATGDPGGGLAYVALHASGEVAEVDLANNCVNRKIEVGQFPRYVDISRDGRRLAVGLAGEGKLAVVDLDAGEVAVRQSVSSGINLGHVQIDDSTQQAYFPWMVYRSNPITKSNIRRGWVLASRVARVRIDRSEYREAISLDPRGEAVADPHGIALTPDRHRLLVTSSGTHELLVYRVADLPFMGIGGPGDLIEPELLEDDDLFYRIELGGRPLGMVASEDSRRVYIANDTLDAVQIVDFEQRRIVDRISLGEPPIDEHVQLVHRGREIFFDARRSLDQWYSCHSCHLDGGSNAKAMDTWNDGSELTNKTVLALYNVDQTGPWTWHGWQDDLRDSLQNSFTSTMQGPQADEGDIDALQAYLASLELPPNPFRQSDGTLSTAAERGKRIFESAEFGCIDCHAGPRFTDGQIHDVGLGSENDAYEGYNTPSLLGLYRRPRYLHDGRGTSLKKVLTQYHLPQEIGGGAELNEEQLADLIEYLKSL
jgi:DNA-binding beta-propeller fold protein YncE/cytochrome c